MNSSGMMTGHEGSVAEFCTVNSLGTSLYGGAPVVLPLVGPRSCTSNHFNCQREPSRYPTGCFGDFQTDRTTNPPGKKGSKGLRLLLVDEAV